MPRTAISSVDALVEELVDGLSSYLDRPFALFRHSMGALVAFELARRLRLMGVEPVHLFASGFRKPHLPSRRSQDRHLLPDRELLEAIRDLNGVPLELLENPEFMDLMLPTLQSDFQSGRDLRVPSTSSAILPRLRIRWPL